MTCCAVIPSTWSSRLLSVLRIVAALCFMQHGCMKLFGFPYSAEHDKVADLMSMMGAAGILEVFGGGLLLIGFFTPLVAFILSGEMAVAYFMMHFPQSFYPALNGGEAAVLYCFVFLYIAAAGPGCWSVDAFLSRRIQPKDL